MSLVRIKFTSLILFSFLPVLLVLAASLPVKITQAAPTPPNVALLCLGKDSAGGATQTSSVEWPVAGKCNSKTTAVVPSRLPSDFKALCAVYDITKSAAAIYNGVNSVGKTSCDDYSNDPTKYTSVNLIPRSSVKGVDPTTVTEAPQTQSSGGTTNSTSTKNTSGNSAKPTSNANGSGCPEGFESKGPLCIPINVVCSGEGVACQGTVGGLASTIISILLGLAGIVAVIMIIIGGYQVMTARGNETQQTNGRKTLTNALIGLAIIIVSFAVVQAVTNYLTNKT